MTIIVIPLVLELIQLKEDTTSYIADLKESTAGFNFDFSLIEDGDKDLWASQS